jgi:predicted transcriptional regulator
MKRMITIYQREPSASNRKVADEIGVSHTTVSDLLSNLVSKQVVHVEKVGRGKTVTVNGKLSAFLAGEI